MYSKTIFFHHYKIASFYCYRIRLDESTASTSISAVATPCTLTTKPNLQVQLRVFSGNVELAIQCKKLSNTANLLLEIFASVISVRRGEEPYETILLLRNAKGGPVLQVSHFAVDVPLQTNLKNVRCICRISCTGRVLAHKIQEVTEMSVNYIGRLQAISQCTLNKIARNPFFKINM